MTETVFVDTNVLVYKADPADQSKQVRAALWMAELFATRTGRTSFQVLQEYFVKATQKRPDLRETIRAEIRELLAWRPIEIDSAVLERSWTIQDRYRLSFWDSLIVAAARAASCRWLLTEDLQAGQEIDGVQVVNPFQMTPDQILK